MAKWGMWARAGFVLYCVGVLLFPIGLWFSVNSELSRLKKLGYDFCIRDIGNDHSKWETCWDAYTNARYVEFWPFWSETILATMIGGAIIWALLWGFGLILQWVLAGRKNNHNL